MPQWPIADERRGRPLPTASRIAQTRAPDVDPLWYKDAVIYQLHVRAFFDSNDDGIGDFRGLTQKLDYIQDLGVNTIWLLPFYPSPLQGRRLRHRRLPRTSTRATARATTSRQFVREAHRRGLRVITELVDQPHLRPAPVVPGRAPRAGRARRSATTTSGATTRRSYSEHAHHLHRHREVELGVGRRSRRRTTGTASSATSRT